MGEGEEEEGELERKLNSSILSHLMSSFFELQEEERMKSIPKLSRGGEADVE